MIVSVVIPCFNGAAHLERCLRSVQAQSRVEWEAIVVDDGSTDDSAAVAARITAADPRVRLVSQANRGAAAARNAGIAASRGELVGFLDADDEWLPHKLAAQIDHLDRHPETTLVAGGVVVIDTENGEAGGAALPAPRACPGFRTVGFEDFLFGAPRVATSTVLARRTALERAGGFREHYRIIEDFNLWMRIARESRIDVLGLPLARYHRHAGNASRDRLTVLRQKIGMWEREIMADRGLADRYGTRLAARLQRMYWRLGRMLDEQGDRAGAREAWQQARRLPPLRPARLKAALRLALG